MSLRLSALILPIHRWPDGGRERWTRAEELGFHAAYTYDHLSWRNFRDGPWFGAVPTLTAAAAVTDRIRLGTMVTSPNFRHPVTFAKDLMTLDDVSGGRLTLGIGAGTATGFDATVLGHEAWSLRERTARFAELVRMLDRLLTEPAVTERGTFYAADEARMIPGCVQQPRIPFAVAATGPKGMRLAARYGQAWVTTGDQTLADDATEADSAAGVAGQIRRLGDACAEARRDAGELDRVLLTGFTPAGVGLLGSVDAFVDAAGRYADAGVTELVLHWPVPDSQFAADQAMFERIATEAPAQLA
ncbi:alkanesulfonate monooxygenase SsuD/methylene tetrahydromethanopterin reductase-like flavin-dependent oxidoreductase (luciferase family) [Mumia flava]|uniref:Alkanesulfonate monooxygenase SsuD/methylene tetrahydromethanopterin reductase-like flavin-dependent oxidoreductase (Luciferase family) n=1 Tax=Mumia flava TaxID=1348852 RepID=A0A0B2BP72_9ACTN|nr:LLM class flavin-dependent oxidoreductase [Mumia flava]PJJ57056.1 alkanesulfonate monooxygenase SsuD/methylene tetrahydromethanopterin reductase-like flavin-dependent oxidoreductase (luciferase family) [Mumia flava]